MRKYKMTKEHKEKIRKAHKLRKEKNNETKTAWNFCPHCGKEL